MSSNGESSRANGGVRRAQGPSTSNRGKRRTPGNGKKNGAAGSEWRPVNGTGSAGDGDGDDDEEVCLICAGRLEVVALSPCNHPTCHKCCLRQRALYEKKQCLFCRGEVENIILTDKLDETYGDLAGKLVESRELKNEKLGIQFTSEGVKNRAMKLLQYTCPFGDVDRDLGSFKKMNEHLKQEHNRNICMLCAGHKRAFPSELEVMSVKQLKAHESRGDPKDGFNGHPMCGFCTGKRFYSDDELYKHMKLSHEWCHICDQLNPAQPQYFKNYDDLFEHFRSAHYVCAVPSCLDSKFVVFADELDLKAHIIKDHPHLAGDNRRALSLVDSGPRRFRSEITTFSNPTRVVDVQEDHSNPANSRDVKRKRMEQRARHYLGNSKSDFDAFMIINDLFNKNEISAQELQSKYEDLFQNHKDDIHLLIYDFSELFHSTSEKHKQLRAIYDNIMKKKENATKFRPLASPDTSTAVNVVRGKWGQKASGSVKGSNVKFTSLPAVAEPIFSTRAPYTNLRRNESTPTPVIKTGLASKSSSSSSLNYANNNNNNNSTMSGLAGSKQFVSSQPNVTAIKSSTPTSFPKLQPPKQKKFVAPPVKQHNIPNPSSWGKTSTSNSNSSDDLVDLNALGNTLPNTGGNKKKSKQKQLLFHIGI